MASGSASTVTVWPEGGGDTFMVSDDGGSLFEVMAGAFSGSIFRRVAKERCERYGAVFDGGSMIYLRVSAGKLRGAIVAMANLMKEVVDETIERSINQKARQIDLELWDKLDQAFGGSSIVRKAHLSVNRPLPVSLRLLFRLARGWSPSIHSALRAIRSTPFMLKCLMLAG